MKKKNKEKIEKLKEIDIDVRRSFGKFYFFSIFIYILLLLLVLLLKKLNIVFVIVVLVFILGFYIYMLIDLYRKKSKYWTGFTSILILIFILMYTMDVLKIVFYLLK